MTPAVDLKITILPELFPNAKIFAYRIPEDYQKLETLPIIKVEGVNEINESYGSDQYGARSYRVQVMAFLDIEETDIEDFNDVLDRGLEAKGYTLAYADDRPHDQYENVQVITRQYNVVKIKERG